MLKVNEMMQNCHALGGLSMGVARKKELISLYGSEEAEPTPKPTPDKPSSKGADKQASRKALPKTGDEASALPVAFLLASGSAALLVGRRLRKDDC